MNVILVQPKSTLIRSINCRAKSIGFSIFDASLNWCSIFSRFCTLTFSTSPRADIEPMEIVVASGRSLTMLKSSPASAPAGFCTLRLVLGSVPPRYCYSCSAKGDGSPLFFEVGRPSLPSWPILSKSGIRERSLPRSTCGLVVPPASNSRCRYFVLIFFFMLLNSFFFFLADFS